MSDTATAADDRRTERSTDANHDTGTAEPALRWGSALLVLSGVGLVLNGAAMLYRAFFSAGFEAGVATLDGLGPAELAAQYHEVAHYVHHLHVNVAGLMIALGVAVAALSWYGVRDGQRWAWTTTVALPAIFLVHSLPVHRTAEFSFDALVHLGPGLLWLPALVVGGPLAYRGLHPPDAERAGARDDR